MNLNRILELDANLSTRIRVAEQPGERAWWGACVGVVLSETLAQGVQRKWICEFDAGFAQGNLGVA